MTILRDLEVTALSLGRHFVDITLRIKRDEWDKATSNPEQMLSLIASEINRMREKGYNPVTILMCDAIHERVKAELNHHIRDRYKDDSTLETLYGLKVVVDDNIPDFQIIGYIQRELIAIFITAVHGKLPSP